ncbi:MAG: GNAT family N-acetyltransferase [Alicyclobacillus sp.]|nr:GNAT family N-acetyltransferase [Alicyclobacillus sp.]MCL6516796.1 GNAT family N-acetyltransferase [Alicyclobacillus sp.]
MCGGISHNLPESSALTTWNNRRTSIGYWLGEQFQGRGIMTTACRTMIDIAFHEYKLNRVRSGQ